MASLKHQETVDREDSVTMQPVSPPSETLCQVCELRPLVMVASSPYGSVSFGYCSVCAALQLEPVGFVELVATELCGGWEHTADHLRGYPAWALQMGLATVSGTTLLRPKESERAT